MSKCVVYPLSPHDNFRLHAFAYDDDKY